MTQTVVLLPVSHFAEARHMREQPMSGHLRGVAAHFKPERSLALHVHRLAHSEPVLARCITDMHYYLKHLGFGGADSEAD